MLVQNRLATVKSLDAEVLRKVFDGEFIAVRVPNFYDQLFCKTLSDALYRSLEDQSAGGTIYESDIDSFWNVMNDADRRERYFASALPLQQKLRQLSAPYPSPIDLLRLALDEAWPSGATLMAMSGRKMPFGITRLWRTNSSALPHQDILRREVKDSDEVPRLVSQLGVNVYLDTAEEGGELESWDHVITDEEYEKVRDQYPGSYGYSRDMLPEESLVIAPQVGDLVLVNTLRAHAVREIKRGRRITLSGFVGSAGPDRPVWCWS